MRRPQQLKHMIPCWTFQGLHRYSPPASTAPLRCMLTARPYMLSYVMSSESIKRILLFPDFRSLHC